MKNHVGILFATLECAWEFDVKISCKEVTYNYMWVALYIWYCIQHKVFACNYYNLSINTEGCINTMNCKCSLQLENPIVSPIVKLYIFSLCMVRAFVQIMKSWIHHEEHEWLHINGWIICWFESHMYFPFEPYQWIHWIHK